MSSVLNDLTMKMIEFYQGDAARIQHFIKVHSFARLIGEGEGLDKHTLFVLESATIVHDIGIKPAERIYKSSMGKYQEELGPGEAKPMLEGLGYSDEDNERICYLVGHHHTYDAIDGIDYQILVEADFLVNFYEDSIPRENICRVFDTIFKTYTGKKIAEEMFAIV